MKSMKTAFNISRSVTYLQSLEICNMVYFYDTNYQKSKYTFDIPDVALV